LAEEIKGRIVNIFLPFSQAENYVKEMVADRMILKSKCFHGVFRGCSHISDILKDLKKMSPSHQITMLKFIKNLSMLATTHDALQNSNAIEVLTDLLSSSIESQQYREIPNHVLHILFNLCRLSKPRQEDAALNEIIPILQKIIRTERPLKELALPILCDMAHSGNVGRRSLWNNKGLQFYISLLGDKYWQVTALDAIFVWLQEETAKVEQHLLTGQFATAVIGCYNNLDASPDAFENLLEPLQKLLLLSSRVAASLAHPDLFARTAQKLSSKKALVRGNLLRIIRSIVDAADDATLIRSFGLYDPVSALSLHDPAIMVRELAADLVRSADLAAARASYDSTRTRPATRRSSSSTMASTPSPTLLAPSPFPGTPPLLRTATGKALAPSSAARAEPPRSARLSSAAVHTPSVFRPHSRESVGASASSGSALASTPASARSRLPRTNVGGPTRLTRLTNARREENVTPSHSPGQGRVGVRTGMAPVQVQGPAQRKRRVTSSGVEDGRR